MRNHINVLSIDGGGMYGVVPAEVLRQMEGIFNEPLHHHFDLMVGTSTGAILGGGLASGLRAEKMQQLYLDEAENIFGKPRMFTLDRPKYKGKYLRNTIRKYIKGDMDSLNTKFAASAYNMSKNTSHFFRSWVDLDLDVTDAIIASSSAPTYHPMHNVDGECYTDGGVFAPNPAREALTLALDLFPNKDIKVFSLGTGMKIPNDRDCTDKKRNEGLLWWARRLPTIFLDGMDEVTHRSMEALHIASVVDYYRFDTVLESKRSDETYIDKLQTAIDRMSETLAEQETYFQKAIAAIKG